MFRRAIYVYRTYSYVTFGRSYVKKNVILEHSYVAKKISISLNRGITCTGTRRRSHAILKYLPGDVEDIDFLTNGVDVTIIVINGV